MSPKARNHNVAKKIEKPIMVYNNYRRFLSVVSVVMLSFVLARTISLHSLVWPPTHFPPIFITGRALLQ